MKLSIRLVIPEHWSIGQVQLMAERMHDETPREVGVVITAADEPYEVIREVVEDAE